MNYTEYSSYCCFYNIEYSAAAEAIPRFTNPTATATQNIQNRHNINTTTSASISTISISDHLDPGSASTLRCLPCPVIPNTPPREDPPSPHPPARPTLPPVASQGGARRTVSEPARLGSARPDPAHSGECAAAAESPQPLAAGRRRRRRWRVPAGRGAMQPWSE